MCKETPAHIAVITCRRNNIQETRNVKNIKTNRLRDSNRKKTLKLFYTKTAAVGSPCKKRTNYLISASLMDAKTSDVISGSVIGVSRDF